MGMVYKATDPEIGRPVAVKVLRNIGATQFMSAEAALERFKIEARSAGNLRHPHIITIFEVNTDGESPYIVMDFLEGEALDEVLSREYKLSPEETIRILSQVAEGLDYAHEKGVVHRDIKPSNIVIDKSDNVVILDFGVASITSSPSNEGLDLIMGTPSYMAPEQALNKDVDSRADLFSLAVVAFECLTGNRPYAGNNFTTVVGNILAGNRFSLTELAPELPLTLEAEFERALARERDDRFSSAKEMIDAFASALGVGTTDPRFKVRKRNILGENGEAPAVRPAASEFMEQKNRVTEESGAKKKKVGQRPAQHSLTELDGTDNLVRKLTKIFGIFCLALGALLAWILIADPLGRRGITPQEAMERSLQSTESTLPALGDAELGAVDSVVPPGGKTVVSMSDKEILGVITSKEIDETKVVEALREGMARKVITLLEAALVPLEHDSHVVRKEALKVLGNLRDKRAVTRVLNLLEDHDPLVRIQAAETLASLGDRRVLSYLQLRIEKESDSQVGAKIKKAAEKLAGHPL